MTAVIPVVNFSDFLLKKMLDVLPDYMSGIFSHDFESLSELASMQLTSICVFSVLAMFIFFISKMKSPFDVVKVVMFFLSILFFFHVLFTLRVSESKYETNMRFHEDYCKIPSQYENIARQCEVSKEVFSLGVSGTAFNKILDSLEYIFKSLIGTILTPSFIQFCIGLYIIVKVWAMSNITIAMNRDKVFSQQAEQTFAYQENMMKSLKTLFITASSSSSPQQQQQRAISGGGSCSISKKKRLLSKINELMMTNAKIKVEKEEVKKMDDDLSDSEENEE